MTFSMAEEATIASAGDNRTCSDGRSGENECSSSEGIGSRSRAEYRVPSRRDPYAMEVDRGRNCYTCGGFKHMARHCRNRGQRGRVVEGRRLEYGRRGIEGNFEHLDNLKGMENLESFN